MYRTLRSRQDIEVIGLGSPRTPTRMHRVLERLTRSKRGLPGAGSPPDIQRGRAFASRVRRQLLRRPCNLILAPIASWELAFVKTDVPLIYLSDTTARQQMQHYHEFESPHTPIELEHREQRESLAIASATSLIYSSRWAGESAVLDYQADRRKLVIIPFGANLDHVPHAQAVISAAKARNRDVCRLIFLGRNWLRKGADTSVATLTALRRMGVPAELTLIGVSPPPHLNSVPGLTTIEYLNKNARRQSARLNQLYLESHFVLVPSRADCSPMVIAEANAFGLPAICTNVGGIGELVGDGQNGFTLPADATGDDFAVLIASVFANPDHYERLVSTSRAEFDERLNWRRWGDAVCRVMGQVMNDQVAPATGLDDSCPDPNS